MPTRHQQDQIWKAQSICQPWRQRVTCQVIDADQRQAGCPRQPFGQHDSRQHATNQSGPRRDCNPIEIAQPDPSPCQRPLDTKIQPFHVGAGCDLGHDTAKFGVERRLPFNFGRQDLTCPLDGPHHSCRGIIATALDPQKGQSLAHYPPLPKPRPAGNTKPMATQSRSPVILLTRPALQSVRFADSLLDCLPDVTVLTSPLLVPRFTSPSVPMRDWTAMIFTSETAVEAARRFVADGLVLPTRAYCVGRQTALTAASAGFDPISADGNAEDLVALITDQSPRGPLLYLHGRDTRGTVGENLNSAGIETLSLEVYAQDLQPLSAEVTALLMQPNHVIAPVFSPRAAQALARECNRIGIRAALSIVAISPAAAKAFGAGDITIAARPDAQSMIAAITSRMIAKAKP